MVSVTQGRLSLLAKQVFGLWLAMMAASGAWANLNAADSTNAQDLWAQGLTGSGVTVGVWEAFDGGRWMVRDTHELFRSYNPTTGQWDGPSRVTFGDTPPTGTGNNYSSHATHVAGTIAGAHLPGQETAWGMAPGAAVVSFDVNSDTFEMRTEAAGLGIDITNHSYGYSYGLWSDQNWNIPQEGGGTQSLQYRTFGHNSSYYRNLYDEDPRYGRYEYAARDLDNTLYQNPKLLSFWSAGNEWSSAKNKYHDRQGDGKYVARFSAGFTPVNGVSLGNNHWLVHKNDYALPGLESGGYDTLAGDKNAKNSVVVGALNDYTTDPHGSYITTSMAGFSSFGPTDDGRLGVTIVANGTSLRSADRGSDTAYGTKSGTSMSSPNAAGTAALLLEHWRNEIGYTPDAATQKGLLVHTATDVRSNASSHIGPDYRSGFGLINAAKAAAFIDQLGTPGATAHMFELTLDQDSDWSYDFLAIGGPVKATLIWHDPAWTGNHTGQDDRTPALVNDLDLLLTDAFGQSYLPWTLDPENPNNNARRDRANRLDNVEQVLADSIALGTSITLDVSHFGSLTGGEQRFSLLVDGARVQAIGDTNNDGLVNAQDIDRFITALGSPAPTGDLMLDFNNDGIVDKADHALLVTTMAFTSKGIGTFFGDADLNGQVDEADLIMLASSWKTAAGWALGDFNADGVIDEFDLAILAANWQAGVTSPTGVSFAEALSSVTFVPEPTALAGLVFPALVVVTRRRTRPRVATWNSARRRAA